MVEKETIEFDGKIWYRYPNSKRSSDRNYYQRCGKFLHHYIWEKYNGQRKKGFLIHHIDGDFANNSIENLEEITPKEHRSIKHKLEGEKLNKRQEWANQIRSLTTVWHKSQKGKEWHKKHALEQGFGNFEFGVSKCEVCGKEYIKKTTRQRFCSNTCKSQYRRNNKLDQIEKTCEFCQQKFYTNKFKNARFCSKQCGSKYMWQQKNKEN